MEEAQESGKNQFNYSERAAQTFNAPYRERGVPNKVPPHTALVFDVELLEVVDE